MNDACHEVAANFRKTPGLPVVIENWPAVAVEEAEMNMSAVADSVWSRDRRKTHRLPEAMCHRPRKLARDHRIVRRPQPDRGRGCDLELLRPIFGQEGIRNHSRLPHRRQQRLAEEPLP